MEEDKKKEEVTINLVEDSPKMPEPKEEKKFTTDIQKELEAKFDELFGPSPNK